MSIRKRIFLSLSSRRKSLDAARGLGWQSVMESLRRTAAISKRKARRGKARHLKSTCPAQMKKKSQPRPLIPSDIEECRLRGHFSEDSAPYLCAKLVSRQTVPLACRGNLTEGVKEVFPSQASLCKSEKRRRRSCALQLDSRVRGNDDMLADKYFT